LWGKIISVNTTGTPPSMRMMKKSGHPAGQYTLVDSTSDLGVVLLGRGAGALGIPDQ